jgi:hypothetical protein
MADTAMDDAQPRCDALTPTEIRRIAVEAGVEPRTVAKYIRGERVVSTCADRICRTLEMLGLSRRAVAR